jgi:hypothetical protein
LLWLMDLSTRHERSARTLGAMDGHFFNGCVHAIVQQGREAERRCVSAAPDFFMSEWELMSDYPSTEFADLPLFATPLPIETLDPSVEPCDAGRLRGQNLLILRRLESGPATNDELSQIARKYTSRISDVRAWLNRGGRTIECERVEGGLFRYWIEVIE